MSVHNVDQSERIVVGIGGGSGSGKSTVSHRLAESLPGLVTILHFDDYGERELAPVKDGMTVWDDPRAFDFKKLAADLEQLRQGFPVKVLSRDPDLNPNENKEDRVWVELPPHPIVVLEGFLCLHDETVRSKMDLRVFLDAELDVLLARRTEPTSTEYRDNVLIPLHREHVEPTRVFADIVVDTAKTPIEQTVSAIRQKILALTS